MSISNYAELQTAVANWTHRSDLGSIIPDLIRVGELRIFREVRCREMESALSGTIASGVLAVPADFLELKAAYIDASPSCKLGSASLSQIYETYPLRSAAGKPQLIAREGDNFIFGPYPDANYDVSGIYYAEPTSIQTSANDLFVAYPDLYLFAALCEAAPYIKDTETIALLESKYAFIVNQIRSKDRLEAYSGGGLRVTSA